MHESIRNSVVSAIGINRTNYARGLNCRERYHTRELMSFHFIFVINFIRDKNPLYGTLPKQNTEIPLRYPSITNMPLFKCII